MDQTHLSYVNAGKYTLSFKGAKNISIKVVDDKRQITATFAVSCTGRVFANPANSCRENLTKSAQVFFSTFFFDNVHKKSLVKHREICWIFSRNTFSFLGRHQTKQKLPLEHYALKIMDPLRQDNDTLKKQCAENNCDVVIVPQSH